MDSIFSFFYKFKKSYLIKALSIYSIGGIANKIIPFLLIPILTKYLNPTEYGIAVTFVAIVAVFTPIVGFNGNTTITRFYFDIKEKEFDSFITDIIKIIGIMTIILTFIFLIFSRVAENIFNLNSNILIIVPLTAGFTAITGNYLTILQVSKNPINYILFTIALTLTNLGLSVFLVVFMNWGYLGRIGAIIISTLIFGSLSFNKINKNDLFSFNLKFLPIIISFGAPLFVNSISGWVLTLGNRIIINKTLNLASTGIFSISYSIAMIIQFIDESFGRAFMPIFFEKMILEDEREKIKLVKIIYAYMLVLLVITIFLGLFSDFIVHTLTNKSYWEASKLVPWLTLGYWSFAGYKVLLNLLLYLKKTIIMGLSSLISAVITIILMIWFIYYWGLIGSSYAICLSNLFSMFFLWIYIYKHLKMPWNPLLWYKFS